MNSTNNMDLNSIYFNITGPDGVGKSTVLANILKQLNNRITFREPGGTPEAEIIREIILGIDENERNKNFDLVLKMDILDLTRKYLEEAYKKYKQIQNMKSSEKMRVGEIEAYLYAASRNETNNKVVKKNLEQNRTIIGSRSVACSMAYQAGARGLGYEFVWDLNKPALTKLPDFEIYLDIDTDIAMERLKSRVGKQDRLDQEDYQFHRKVREGYLEYYKNYCPYEVHIVDASGTIQENTKKVMDIIKYKNKNKEA